MSKRKDGCIINNKDGSVTIQVYNDPDSVEYGSVCINPEETDPKKQIFQKTFYKRKFYTEKQYEQAVQDNLFGKYVFVLSANGYSYLSDDLCSRYGINPDDYIQACRAIIGKTIEKLRAEFRKVDIKLTYGVSDMEVDKALKMVADDYGLSMLGFSCFKYILYAKDDDVPVVLTEDPEKYSDLYIKATDLLITTGGREVSLSHDVSYAVKNQTRVLFVDVLNNLAPEHNVPAVIYVGGKPKIENAAALFGNMIYFCDTQHTLEEDADNWPSIFRSVGSVATKLCRIKMPADGKFNI